MCRRVLGVAKKEATSGDFEGYREAQRHQHDIMAMILDENGFDTTAFAAREGKVSVKSDRRI